MPLVVNTLIIATLKVGAVMLRGEVIHPGPRSSWWSLFFNSGSLDPESRLLATTCFIDLARLDSWLPLYSRPRVPARTAFDLATRKHLPCLEGAWSGDFHSRVTGLLWWSSFGFATWFCGQGLGPGAAMLFLEIFLFLYFAESGSSGIFLSESDFGIRHFSRLIIFHESSSKLYKFQKESKHGRNRYLGIHPQFCLTKTPHDYTLFC